jgi:hypothetical protein
MEYLEWMGASMAISDHGADRQHDPLREAVGRRLQRLMAEALARADEARLATAAAADTNFGVAMALLETVARDEAVRRLEPWAEARLRGLAARRALIERGGGMLDVHDVASLLGIGVDAVAKRRQAGKLLAMPRGERAFDYPACQFGTHAVVPHLERLLAATQGLEPWVRLDLLTSPREELGGLTPLQAAERGEVEDAVAAVAVLAAEHV